MESLLQPCIVLARAAGLLTPHCERMLANGEYTDSLCLKQFISRALNVAIIAGSIFLQLPQILKVLASKSVVGLSEMTFLIQVCVSILMTLDRFVSVVFRFVIHSVQFSGGHHFRNLG